MEKQIEYSEVYKDKLEPQIIEFTQRLIKRGLWNKRLSTKAKFKFMQEWVERCSDFYGIKTPELVFVGGIEGKLLYIISGGGMYVHDRKAILLFSKISLTTLLHEFRHAMQHAKAKDSEFKLFCNDVEEDARAWSLSLFKLSAPKAFEKAVKKNTIWRVVKKEEKGEKKQ